MKTRLITSAVGIMICIALLIIGERFSLVINLAIALVTAILCFEFLSAKSIHKNYRISVPCISCGLLMPLLSHFIGFEIPLYLFTVILFILMVVFHDTVKVNDVLFAYGGTLLITLPMSALANCGEFGHISFWVVLTLGVPWLADSGAYFAGVYLGKRKLCPTISPKKTVEGAIGGLICGTLGALLIGYIFSLIYIADLSAGGSRVSADVDYIALIIIGLINPIVSIFGDLTFSLIKRSCGIKDFGTIMPGHGGLLDRFDSVIFCAPLVYIISQYTEIIYIY